MGVGLEILHLELKGSQTSNIYLCTVHAIYVQGLENSATHNINNSILVIYVSRAKSSCRGAWVQTCTVISQKTETV